MLFYILFIANFLLDPRLFWKVYLLFGMGSYGCSTLTLYCIAKMAAMLLSSISIMV